MLVDRPHILLEQLCHQLLRQPDRFIFQPNLDARVAVFGLIEEDSRAIRYIRQRGHGLPPEDSLTTKYLSACNAQAGVKYSKTNFIRNRIAYNFICFNIFSIC